MKNIKLSFFGAVVMAMFMFTSCDDPCKDVTCLNGGTCLEGTCECPTGYEGTDCGTAVNAKFAGTFNMASSMCDTTDNNNYPVALIASETDVTAFTIGGIYENGLANTVNATVNLGSTSTFTIPNQTFTDDDLGGGFTIEGSGSLEGSTLTITYSIFDVTFNQPWEGCTDTFQ